MIKKVLIGLVFVFLFVNIFLVNIIFHELGHYMTARYYDLEPEMSIEFENIEELSFSFKGVPIASTSFLDNGNRYETALVAFAGPFVNLLFSIGFVLLFFIFKDNFYIKETAIIGFIISLGSCLMNLIPIAGNDGSLILGLF